MERSPQLATLPIQPIREGFFVSAGLTQTLPKGWRGSNPIFSALSMPQKCHPFPRPSHPLSQTLIEYLFYSFSLVWWHKPVNSALRVSLCRPNWPCTHSVPALGKLRTHDSPALVTYPQTMKGRREGTEGKEKKKRGCSIQQRSSDNVASAVGRLPLVPLNTLPLTCIALTAKWKCNPHRQQGWGRGEGFQSPFFPRIPVLCIPS